MKISLQFQTLLYRIYLSFFIIATFVTACFAIPVIFESLSDIESYNSNKYSWVLNVNTKAIEKSLTAEEFKRGYLSGTFALNGTKPILLLDPDSKELYEFESAKVQEALGRGFEFATEQQALTSIEYANTNRKSHALTGILFLIGIPIGIFLLKQWIVWLFCAFITKAEVGS